MFDVTQSTGEIWFYDYIGPEWMGMIDAGAVKAALDQIGADRRVTLRINSGGGSVNEAIAIRGMLERHRGGVDVVVDAIAASAASFLAPDGAKVTIAKGGAMMIHSPMFGMAFFANAVELRKLADELDFHEGRVIGYYEARMKGYDREQIKQLLDAETWFDADQSVAAGLADEIGNPAVDPADMPEQMLRHAPAAIAAAVVAKQQQTKPGDRTPMPLSRVRTAVNLWRAKK